MTDSVLGKRVLTYWENRGNLYYHWMNVFIVAMKNYIFLERGESHLSKKYIVFHGYIEGIHVDVTWISLIFPRFPSTLAPFSQIRNPHISRFKHYNNNNNLLLLLYCLNLEMCGNRVQ